MDFFAKCVQTWHVPTRAEIGRRIKDLRLNAGLSQTGLAAELRKRPYSMKGCERFRVGKWERGENAPSTAYANALAAYFKTEPECFSQERAAEELAEGLAGFLVRFDDLERRVRGLEDSQAQPPAQGDDRAAGEDRP